MKRQTPGISVEAQLCSFGVRLHELRTRRGLTLDELAGRSGLTKSFLCRLESGGRQASIAAVLTLARVLEVSLAHFFDSPLVAEPCVIVRGADVEEKTANGLKYAALSSAGRFSRLQPLRIRVSPTRRGAEHYQHKGEEWLYVLSGKLTLSLAGNTYDLGPGDAAHFDACLPHRLIAAGPEDAHVLLVASPESNPNDPPAFLGHRAILDMAATPLRRQRRIAAPAMPEKTSNPPPLKPPTKSPL